jgi:hypothetical protein
MERQKSQALGVSRPHDPSKRTSRPGTPLSKLVKRLHRPSALAPLQRACRGTGNAGACNAGGRPGLPGVVLWANDGEGLKPQPQANDGEGLKPQPKASDGEGLKPQPKANGAGARHLLNTGGNGSHEKRAAQRWSGDAAREASRHAWGWGAWWAPQVVPLHLLQLAASGRCPACGSGFARGLLPCQCNPGAKLRRARGCCAPRKSPSSTGKALFAGHPGGNPHRPSVVAGMGCEDRPTINSASLPEVGQQ